MRNYREHHPPQGRQQNRNAFQSQMTPDTEASGTSADALAIAITTAEVLLEPKVVYIPTMLIMPFTIKLLKAFYCYCYCRSQSMGTLLLRFMCSLLLLSRNQGQLRLLGGLRQEARVATTRHINRTRKEKYDSFSLPLNFSGSY